MPLGQREESLKCKSINLLSNQISPGGMLRASLKLSSLRRTSLRFTSRASGPIAIVAILLVGGVATHRSVSRDPQPVSETRALVLSLLGSTRPFEGRLFGMEYRPFDPDQEWRPEPRALARVAKDLRQKAKAGEEKVLAEIALVEALGGDLDRAILLLDEAARGEGAKAWIWSDLAAFYLAQGAAGRSPLLYSRALLAADKAISLDASLLEARFNRALALEFLGVSWKAESAWQEYLALDKSSDWTEEVRRHHRRLRRSPEDELWTQQKEQLITAAALRQKDVLKGVVSKFRFRTRTYGEEELLGQWADRAQERRPVDAGRILAAVRELGRAIAEVSGDQMLADSVRTIDEARFEVSTREFDLAEGHANYRDGLKAYEAQNLSLAIVLLGKAQQQLLGLGSPMGHCAGVHLATSFYHENRYQEAQEILEEVRREAPATRYPNLHGRALWILGLIAVVQSRYDQAHSLYRQALEMYYRSGELESAASIHALIAEYFYFIGELGEQWRHLGEALALLDRVPDSRRKHFILWNGTLAGMQAGEPGIALYFQEELVRLAEASGDPVRIIQALSNRAQLRFDAGMPEEGLRDLADAKKYLELDESLLGETLLIESELRQRSDPSAALDAANQAVESFERTNYRAGLPRALLARARASIALADPTRATEDFTAALKELSLQREDLLLADSRAQFFDEARKFFDEAAAYHVTAFRRPDLAYGFVEHSQARLLLDVVAGQTGLDRTDFMDLPRIEEISHRIPADVVLIQFAVLEDRTLAWALWKDGAHFGQAEIGRRELAAKVSKFRAAILKNGQNVFNTLGRELYPAVALRKPYERR